MMTQRFRKTTRIIKENMGTVDKHIGDAVMAYSVAEVGAYPKREVVAALNTACALVHSSHGFSDRPSSRFQVH